MMKISKILYGFLFIAVTSIVVVSCKDDDELYPQLGDNPKNIAEIASETPDLTSFSSAIFQAGLDTLLRTTTTYDVFAPNNDAFGASTLPTPDDEYINALLNHIIITTTPDFTSAMTTGYLTTMATGPDDLNLSFFTNTDGTLEFNGIASPLDGQANIGATNGLVHIVDAVLLPPTVADHAKANPNYSSFVEAMELADFTDGLEGEGPFTLFAPNNAAFEDFMTTVNGAYGWETLSDIPVDVLNEMLSYHVVTGENMIAESLDGEQPTTVQGETIAITGLSLDDATYVDANIDLTDVQGINGIVQGIDKVLLPNTLFQDVLSATLNIVGRCEDRGFTTFLEAIEKVGMTDMLSNDELTSFTPNNDAFIALFAEIENFGSLEDFDTPEEIALLTDLLNYQLNAGALQESDLPDGTTVTTIYGDDFSVTGSGADTKLKPSYADAIPSGVLMFNIGATNGVIHEINRVLVPDALVSDLGFPSGGCAIHPVGDTDLVFYDWDGNNEWWGNVTSEGDASISLDGSNYGRANFQTGGTGWQDLFWRNGSTMNGQDVVADNLDEYSLKFDINILEPIDAGAFRIRFNSGINGVDAFYNWAPWNDTGEPFSTDGWETIEIPLVVLGQPNFAEVDNEFGMAFEGADILLNFAIDNVRFDTPGNNCGPDEVVDPTLVFYDWDGNDPWWGNVGVENDASISLDGSNYGRANFQTGGTGWQDLFWRNGSSMNGQATVADNLDDYVLKFDINTLEPLTAGAFRIRFNSGINGVDAFYNWEPWNDTGEPLDTEGSWITVTIPLTVIGQPNYAEVDNEFGMAFEGADVLLNFAIDNVRFELIE